MIILIIHVVVLSLIFGLYLRALRGPFVKIVSTTTLTVCTGVFKNIKPGDFISIPPGPGIETITPVTVVKIEDNNTITIKPGDLPFHTRKDPDVNYIDEIAPYDQTTKKTKAPYIDPIIHTEKPIRYPKMSFEEFARMHMASVLKGAPIDAERIMLLLGGAGNRPLTKRDLKIIPGGKK